MWDFWWKNWHSDKFISKYFSFPLSVSFHHCSYPFIHLQNTLYNVSLPVIQFSPVSTNPPMLHTHSFTYHPRYIRYISQEFSLPVSNIPQLLRINSFNYNPRYTMFPSQYFSFPLSVPFHQCPYQFIHLQHTLYNVILPVIQFSPVSTIPPMLIHIHSPTTHTI